MSSLCCAASSCSLSELIWTLDSSTTTSSSLMLACSNRRHVRVLCYSAGLLALAEVNRLLMTLVAYTHTQASPCNTSAGQLVSCFVLTSRPCRINVTAILADDTLPVAACIDSIACSDARLSLQAYAYLQLSVQFAGLRQCSVGMRQLILCTT